MTLLLAIDQGTSSTRAIIYSLDGRVIANSQYPLKQYFPKPGWVEHDPEEIWQKTLKSVKDVLAQINTTQVVACGITNQRETTVIWNKKTGQCLAPAIVWQDRRTTNFCQSLSAQALMIQEKTGLLPDPYFSASKINWLLQNYPEAKQLAQKGELAFGTIDSFLIWRLTKSKHHVTDTTNAARTLLFNISTQEWDAELLTVFGVPDLILPKVQACDDHFGLIDKTWFNIEIPITGVAGDQQAALIGQGCFEPGMIKATYGTGGFLLLNTGKNLIQSQHRLLSTIAYKIKNETVYGLEGSIYHAGTTVKWLRDTLKLIHQASETESLAQSITTNEGVYLVPAFTGLGAPHWLSKPGGALVGLSLSTQKAHFARAALEGVCYQTREILACMKEDSRLDLSLLRVDGGMVVNQWFLQFLADQCGLNVQKPKDIETTAKGIAIIAALGCGVLASLTDFKAINETEFTFNPTLQREQVEQDFQGWLNALEKIKME